MPKINMPSTGRLPPAINRRRRTETINSEQIGNVIFTDSTQNIDYDQLPVSQCDHYTINYHHVGEYSANSNSV